MMQRFELAQLSPERALFCTRGLVRGAPAQNQPARLLGVARVQRRQDERHQFGNGRDLLLGRLLLLCIHARGRRQREPAQVGAKHRTLTLF